MVILLVLFASLLHAEDFSSEKYCFSTPTSLARQKFSAIQVPSDTVTEDGNCLIIQMRQHRRELDQKYMLSAIPGSSVAFSSAEVKTEICRLKVEKEKNKTTDNTQLNIDGTPSAVTTSTTNVGTEVTQIETISNFELTLDQDQVKGVCRLVTPNRYEITLEVRKNLKPIVPVELPPGTIVVLNHPPVDQETSVLQTQVQLSRGERIEIGSIVKKAKNKDNKVDIKPVLNIETSGQYSSEKVFLSIN